jgi:hypothetical protein
MVSGDGLPHAAQVLLLSPYIKNGQKDMTIIIKNLFF